MTSCCNGSVSAAASQTCSPPHAAAFQQSARTSSPVRPAGSGQHNADIIQRPRSHRGPGAAAATTNSVSPAAIVALLLPLALLLAGCPQHAAATAEGWRHGGSSGSENGSFGGWHGGRGLTAQQATDATALQQAAAAHSEGSLGYRNDPAEVASASATAFGATAAKVQSAASQATSTVAAVSASVSAAAFSGNGNATAAARTVAGRRRPLLMASADDAAAWAALVALDPTDAAGNELPVPGTPVGRRLLGRGVTEKEQGDGVTLYSPQQRINQIPVRPAARLASRPAVPMTCLRL